MASSLDGIRMCHLKYASQSRPAIRKNLKSNRTSRSCSGGWVASMLQNTQGQIVSQEIRRPRLNPTLKLQCQNLLSSTAGSTICLWGIFLPCQKQDARIIIQPRCLSGTAQAGWWMQTWLWLWSECHNGPRAEPAPSSRDTRVERANAVFACVIFCTAFEIKNQQVPGCETPCFIAFFFVWKLFFSLSLQPPISFYVEQGSSPAQATAACCLCSQALW